MAKANPVHVFLLQHEHQLDVASTDVKVIGVYSSESLANEAVARLSSRAGFSENPEGFSVSRYELNKDHWIEGFVTERYPT